jgi:ribosome-binding protein aMBF1 (putative translation factor)
MKTIKRHRLARKWSQAGLARRAKMNATTISIMDAERYVPYLSQVEKIISALELSPDEAAEVLDEHRELELSRIEGRRP